MKHWICLAIGALGIGMRLVMECSGYFFCGLFCYYIYEGPDASVARGLMIVNGVAALFAMVVVRVVSHLCLEEC